jgi:large subunit ribosomal protein L3
MSENNEAVNQEQEAAESSSSASLKLDGFFGIKVGMTSVYTDQGVRVPVTVLECNPWTVTQIKTKDKDGYEAVQISSTPKKLKSSLKSELGHFKKSGLQTGMRYSREVRQQLPQGIELGQKVGLDSFEKGQILKVSAISKGHGFSGPVRRHNFGGGPATHGSGFHRRPGSIGNREFPGRVMPGKKMAGQYGNEMATTKGLEIIDVLKDQNVLLVKGAVPGAKNALVQITKL